MVRLARITKTLAGLLGAVALVGLAVYVWPPRPPERSVMLAAIGESMRGNRYTIAAAQARSYTRLYPKEVEPYGMWIGSLALANRMDEAKAAFETAKAAFPDLVEKYPPQVAELAKTLDKIEAGHKARTDAESAAARGLPVLAARKLAEAYEIFTEDDGLGLQTAQMWAWVHEPVKAALILRKLANKGDPEMAEEAQAFLDDNKSDLTSAAVAAAAEGWKALNAYSGDDAAATRAKELFQRAIDLRPDEAGFTGAGVAPVRSPYLGLATALAAGGETRGVPRMLVKGAANGMAAPSGPLEGRAGTALGVALCDPDAVEALDGAYGERAKAWGEAACARAQEDKEWQDAVDVFNKANKEDVTIREALAGFEEAKGLFAREWDARFPSTSYAGRTDCNIAFLKTWVAAAGDEVDHGELDRAVAASAACPTKDFSRSKLEARVAAARVSTAKRNGFPVKICNRSGDDKIWVAMMRERPESSEGLTLQGWWDVGKGKCLDLPASFGVADVADIYLTGYSASSTSWPWQKADVEICVPTKKVERPGVLMADITCPDGESLRGFMRLTARKKVGRNGITYNFRDPPMR